MIENRIINRDWDYFWYCVRCDGFRKTLWQQLIREWGYFRRTSLYCYWNGHNTERVQETEEEAKFAVVTRMPLADRVQCRRCGKRLWSRLL